MVSREEEGRGFMLTLCSLMRTVAGQDAGEKRRTEKRKEKNSKAIGKTRAGKYIKRT